jgi:hypothetical protein
MASYCIICHREEARGRDLKIRTWKLEYNRVWRRNNRDKVNEYARRYYLKVTRNSWGVEDASKVQN